jgi:hypothetical protein
VISVKGHPIVPLKDLEKLETYLETLHCNGGKARAVLVIAGVDHKSGAQEVLHNEAAFEEVASRRREKRNRKLVPV